MSVAHRAADLVDRADPIRNRECVPFVMGLAHSRDSRLLLVTSDCEVRFTFVIRAEDDAVSNDQKQTKHES